MSSSDHPKILPSKTLDIPPAGSRSVGLDGLEGCRTHPLQLSPRKQLSTLKQVIQTGLLSPGGQRYLA